MKILFFKSMFYNESSEVYFSMILMISLQIGSRVFHTTADLIFVIKMVCMKLIGNS